MLVPPGYTDPPVGEAAEIPTAPRSPLRADARLEAVLAAARHQTWRLATFAVVLADTVVPQPA